MPNISHHGVFVMSNEERNHKTIQNGSINRGLCMMWTGGERLVPCQMVARSVCYNQGCLHIYMHLCGHSHHHHGGFQRFTRKTGHLVIVYVTLSFPVHQRRRSSNNTIMWALALSKCSQHTYSMDSD